jgi:acetyltransferase EpsM
MPEKIIIVGAGSQGVIAADALAERHAADGSQVAVGFVDDTASLQAARVLGLAVLGTIASLHDHEHDSIIVAIGDNRVRRELTERMLARGELLTTVIHPFTSIAASASIERGTMISAGVVISPHARIGKGVLLNTRCCIDHDSVIGDFTHVAPGATIGGKVFLGEEALIAQGATVVTGCTVGSRSVVGAGAVVVRDVPEGVRVWGVPARVIASRAEHE